MFKKAVFIILFIFIEQVSFAQIVRVEGSRPLSFGFNFGLNHSFLDYESNNTVSETNKIGFRLGVLGEYQISKRFFLSTQAELSVNNNRLKINESEVYEVMPIGIETMVHFSHKFGEGTSKPYVFVGPNLKIPLANKDAASEIFRTGHDFALDVGIGLDRNFSHFIFAPELRYSHGLRDINKNSAIERIYLHQVSLLFNFKG